LAVFTLCALLSALITVVGIQSYSTEQTEYGEATEKRQAERERLQESGHLLSFRGTGFLWNRPPEPLSPIVNGLSGVLGREAGVRVASDSYLLQMPHFQSSPFEQTPSKPLFGVIDLFFIVQVVLSLTAIVFTYDAVCGEKEEGTLRLTASFPVSRATLCAGKLIGATISVLVPFLFAFLLAATITVVSPEVHLGAED